MGTIRAHLVPLEAPEDVLETAPGTPVPSPALDLPSRPGPGWPTLAALAAGCGLFAIVLGAWALAASVRPDGPAATSPALEQALDVLSSPATERYALRGSLGRIALVVGVDDRAVLVLDGLGPAPEGRVYAAWLVPPGSATPLRVATFSATERAVPLARPVARGARVAVTLEQAPAPDRPSRPLRLVAVRP